MKFSLKNKKDRDPFSVDLDVPKSNKLEDKSRKLEWTENSFLADVEEKESLRLTFDFSYTKKISFFLLAMLVLLLSRAVWLQIINGDHYEALAQGNRVRVQEIEADRGVIYDRQGEVLVRNSANFMLYLTPGDLPREEGERERVLDRLTGILNPEDREDYISKDRIIERIEQVGSDPFSVYQPLFLTDNIEYEKAISLYLASRDMPGVTLSSKSRREYLNQPDPFEIFATSTVEDLYSRGVFDQGQDSFVLRSLSHVLGYTGKISHGELERNPGYSPIDYIGKSGLEHVWESQLRGEKGRKQVEVDALGKEKRVISEEDPVKGNDLHLTLDRSLQAQVEFILRKYLKDLDEDSASAVAMNPHTGGILAMVSLPGFDNNLFAKGLSSEEYQKMAGDRDYSLYNRAISGEYPVGSTIKPVMAAAALEEGIISANTTVNSTGGISVGPWFFPDWRRGGHGITNVYKAIAQSVNTFFYYIGGGYRDFSGLGLEKMVNYFEEFGLGSRTGIDLPGESSGFLPSREWKRDRFEESWYVGDTYNLSIGQGYLLATPLQVANFTSVFANKGSLNQPHLVSHIEDHQGEVINIDNQALNQNFLDDYVVDVVRQGMRQTVTSGSGVRLSLLDVSSAGKTGTAQWSSTEDNHAWYTAFAPFEEAEIVVTVLVEKGGEGSEIAVPITLEILDHYFDNEEENG